jgi:hypothetical protein
MKRKYEKQDNGNNNFDVYLTYSNNIKDTTVVYTYSTRSTILPAYPKTTPCREHWLNN